MSDAMRRWRRAFAACVPVLKKLARRRRDQRMTRQDLMPSTRHEMASERNMNDRNGMRIASAKALVIQAMTKPGVYDESLREARALLEAALADDPRDVAILTCLGAVLCDLHLRADARACLTRAIELGSTDRNTFFNLFVAMLGPSTMEEARAVLARGTALDADPATWEAYFDPHAM
ncbi:UDP-N-acetylglucosamine-peptide N-acetylglucosaminyltransferase [Burkholderia pseudomultivorans]|nr:UDP-N-acetylglucosamine-peptide N-acetylglucosaminyltransferase [Burkholderia pseudomultivorans]